MVDYVNFFNIYVIGSVQMLTGFHFLARFLQKKVKLYFYVVFEIICIINIKFIPSGNITEFFVYIILLAISGILICRTDWKTVILYSSLIVEIMQLSYGLVNSILSVLYHRLFFINQNIGTIFMILGNMALLVSVFCYHMVLRYFLYSETIKKQYILMILTPILMMFFMSEYISSVIYGNIIVTDDSSITRYTNHYQMFIIQLLGMISLFCILFAYKRLLQNFRLSTELSLLKQEEHSLNQYVAEAKTRYEKTKSFRHDIKNHITLVKELLQNGKSEQALNYISDMEGITEELSFFCSTNNPVTDILIGNKLGAAKIMGIDVSCSLILPYPCSIRDIDLCIILSNALDNAVHACNKSDESAEKYIYVRGNIQGDFVLLEIENSFNGRDLVKGGTGLSNIKMITEKYHGAMNIKTENKIFILSVLLIIPQHL